MPLMKYYIGLDAHSTTSTFAVVDEQGQCILRETVKTSEQSLGRVINQIHGERHMTYIIEPGRHKTNTSPKFVSNL
jgi:predicted NBD/HSP70 family sugar kinase